MAAELKMDSGIRHFKNEQILDHCPACLSRDIAIYIVSVDYHYGIDGNFSTDECQKCKSVFINPMPSVSDLATLYPDDYYSFQEPKRPSLIRRLARVLLRYPRITHVPPFENPGTMLDVGCGAGHYMAEMQQKGWTVFGSELSAGAVKAGKAAGFDIRPGELTESQFQPKAFDFIRSNHSFEHIPNPDVILQEMHRLLKDDGKLFIGVPNWGGLFPRIFCKYWWNFGLPVHTFNYTASGLSSALTRNGFTVERVLYNSDFSGLTGSLQIWNNGRSGIRRSSGKIVSNKLLRFPAHYLAKLADVFGVGDCMEVIASKKSQISADGQALF